MGGGGLGVCLDHCRSQDLCWGGNDPMNQDSGLTRIDIHRG